MAEFTTRTVRVEKYEIIKEVKPVKIIMPCSECDGEMEFTGELYCGLNNNNIHKCNKCGFEEVFFDTFPRIEYIDKEK